MKKIDERIKNCTKCGILPKPACNSFQVGSSPILLIGESPARDGWLISGRAFYNTNNQLQPTGKILSKLLNLCNLTIEDISFTECCKCHISDRSKLDECSSNCKNFLISQIKKSNCKIILTMGLFPTQILLDQKIKKLSEYIGKSFNFEDKIVIPIFHCSPINPKAFRG